MDSCLKMKCFWPVTFQEVWPPLAGGTLPECKYTAEKRTLAIFTSRLPRAKEEHSFNKYPQNSFLICSVSFVKPSY